MEYCNNYSINVCMICRYFNDVLLLVLLHCGLCNESCYGKCVRHLDVRITEYIGESNLLKRKSNLETVLLEIISYFSVIKHALINLLF